MRSQALNRREETTARARIVPITPPPIPGAKPRITARELGIDDQFVAYQDELDRLRREQQKAASEITARLNGVDQLIDIANGKIGHLKPDVIRLKEMAELHERAIAHNARISTAHSRIIEELRAEVRDNYLLAASQESLDELQTRLDEIEARETSSYAGYELLTREVKTLKRQLWLSRVQATQVDDLRREKRARFYAKCAKIAGVLFIAIVAARFILF